MIAWQIERVRKRAYAIWQRTGGRHGHDLEHWFQAERELSRPFYVNDTQSRLGMNMQQNAALMKESINPDASIIAKFHAGSRQLEAIFTARETMNRNSGCLSSQDIDALNKGMTEIDRLVARETKTNIPLCVWELYSAGCNPPYLSKAIETDMNYRKQGIAESFMLAVLGAGLEIEPSGTQTSAGARLLNKVYCLT